MSYANRPLNRQDYKTLTLAALGGALEFYDFIIFVFFAAVVGELFFPADIPEWLRQVQTFGIFAAGYLARPLGGIIMAHFGDLVGRKKMFTLSILLMALPTLDWQWVAAGFVIFRIFDMWKPWPIRWFDRNIHGGMGIMVDDIVAGVISAGVLYVIGHHWPIGLL